MNEPVNQHKLSMELLDLFGLRNIRVERTAEGRFQCFRYHAWDVPLTPGAHRARKRQRRGVIRPYFVSKPN